MVVFDANMILRYLLNDRPEMADRAEEYLNAGNSFVTTEVIAEVVYVLHGVYSMERGEISSVIGGFLKLVRSRDADVLRLALEVFGTQKLDFVDCILYAYHRIRGMEIATFDKKLLKLIGSPSER